jgi:hypothetical protein
LIRKRNDSVKGGRGYDDGKGEHFAPDSALHKQFNQGDDHGEREPYSRNANKGGDKFVETGTSQFGPGEGRADHNNVCSDGDFGQMAGTRDIWGDVWKNAGSDPTNSGPPDVLWENSSGGRPGPIKYGVSRSQRDGSKKISRE